MGLEKIPEETLAMRLKRLRKAANLSQQELATRSGLSVSIVSQIEQGREANPRLSTLLAITGVLGIGLDDLVPRPKAKPDRGSTSNS
jgi:transcriptional regulator with XRE-family HTH domain